MSDSGGRVRRAVVERCCLECGIVLAPASIRGTLTEPYRAQLRAREALSRRGNASTLRLAHWGALGTTIGDPALIANTTGAERIEARLAPIPEVELCFRVRRALGLAPTLFPRVVPTADSSVPPLILHEGLVAKIAATRDPNHIRLVAKTLETVKRPLEIWYDRDKRSKRIVRFLAKYSAPTRGMAGVATQLVVMERDTGIALTSYLRRRAQVALDRRGTLRLARWAAPYSSC